nr:unnamed protein product [Callosobruchus analis]
MHSLKSDSAADNGKARPGEENTKAVASFRPPRMVHQVRQIPSLTGYFRHIVRDYASICKPPMNLLNKSVPRRWIEKG